MDPEKCTPLPFPTQSTLHSAAATGVPGAPAWCWRVWNDCQVTHLFVTLAATPRHALARYEGGFHASAREHREWVLVGVLVAISGSRRRLEAAKRMCARTCGERGLSYPSCGTPLRPCWGLVESASCRTWEPVNRHGSIMGMTGIRNIVDCECCGPPLPSMMSGRRWSLNLRANDMHASPPRGWGPRPPVSCHFDWRRGISPGLAPRAPRRARPTARPAPIPPRFAPRHSPLPGEPRFLIAAISLLSRGAVVQRWSLAGGACRWGRMGEFTAHICHNFMTFEFRAKSKCTEYAPAGDFVERAARVAKTFHI